MQQSDIIAVLALLLSALTLIQTDRQNKKINEASTANTNLNNGLIDVQKAAANAVKKANEAEEKTYELERKDKQKLKLRELKSAYDTMLTFDLDSDNKLTTEVTPQQIHSYLRLVDSIAGARNDDFIDKTSADNQLGKFIVIRCRKIVNAKKPVDGASLINLPQYENVNSWLKELEDKFPAEKSPQQKPPK